LLHGEQVVIVVHCVFGIVDSDDKIALMPSTLLTQLILVSLAQSADKHRPGADLLRTLS
jgi:hypothetical protein